MRLACLQAHELIAIVDVAVFAKAQHSGLAFPVSVKHFECDDIEHAHRPVCDVANEGHRRRSQEQSCAQLEQSMRADCQLNLDAASYDNELQDTNCPSPACAQSMVTYITGCRAEVHELSISGKRHLHCASYTVSTLCNEV